MQILPNGKTQLDSKSDLYYHMMIEMGLGTCKENNHLYDQTTGDILVWKDKFIKYNITDQPMYAGKDEVIFSLDENFQLFMHLFAHFLSSLESNEESKIVVTSYYLNHDNEANTSTLSIKFNSKDNTVIGGVMTTSPYLDSWLCYVEAIFLLNDNPGFDFHNFDQERERK